MSLLDHRTRGFRTINVVFCAMFAATAVTVLLAKAYAGREVRDIARTERSIGEENKRIRLLKAEVAHLEQPERLERLSRAYLAMAPVNVKQETTVDDLYAASLRRPGIETPAAPIQVSTEPLAPPIEAEAPSGGAR